MNCNNGEIKLYETMKQNKENSSVSIVFLEHIILFLNCILSFFPFIADTEVSVLL